MLAKLSALCRRTEDIVCEKKWLCVNRCLGGGGVGGGWDGMGGRVWLPSSELRRWEFPPQWNRWSFGGPISGGSSPALWLIPIIPGVNNNVITDVTVLLGTTDHFQASKFHSWGATVEWSLSQVPEGTWKCSQTSNDTNGLSVFPEGKMP